MIIIELFFVQNYLDAISNIKVLYFHYMLGNKAFSKAKVCQIICKQLFYRFTRKNIAKLYLFQAIYTLLLSCAKPIGHIFHVFRTTLKNCYRYNMSWSV